MTQPLSKPGDIRIRTLTAADVLVAAALLGRGMRDNPLCLRTLDDDPAFREKALVGVFRAFLGMAAARKGRVLGAFLDDTLVGLAAGTANVP